jgi:XTP/dITP diphosphohydrolase
MRLVVATGNRHKLAEIEHALAGLPFELVAQGDLGLAEADETATTFVENAMLKARQASRLSGLPALADDSGLMIDALGGRPGLISAHYAGTRDQMTNIEKVLGELRDVPEAKRTARFYSVIVVLRHADDPAPLIAEGYWEGRMLEAPQGNDGFGYNPIFFVPEFGVTASQMDSAMRAKVSHRGKALATLRARLPAFL